MIRIVDQIHSFRTPLGWMAMVGRNEQLQYLTFGHRSVAAAVNQATAAWPGASVAADWNRELADQLLAYASGEPIDFSAVRIDEASLTAFQRKVVRHCRRIPRGDSLTYGELARRVGSPRAARAVGGVMRANRFPIVVPCHRVVAADGGLGGFSAAGGLQTKRRLLALERGEDVGRGTYGKADLCVAGCVV